MFETPRYVMITPAKDEEKYIEHTIRSVLSQSIHPLEWIIVDDGSTDETGRLLDKYAGECNWIQVLHRTKGGSRRAGGRVIEAFYEGYASLRDPRWDFIVKLDCDLSFEPHYFETLLERFACDKLLGIASGVYLEMNARRVWREVVMPPYHAAGACKVLRRNCFEEIEGFVVAAGWDTVDEIRAMARGWRTGHFRELQMKHHKPEGSGVGMVRTSMMHGEIYYLTGGSKMFFLLKVIQRIAKKPYVVGALALLRGYLRAMWEQKTPLVTTAEAQTYRALLHSRMMGPLKKLFARS
jgi:poly-beta-1,6-N-acetyl-D-glucosamine synthase